MRFIVGNTSTNVVIGGVDNLSGYDLMKELREYLRVRVDGYGHTEAYKEHKWDGYRYFITQKGEFPTGFLPYVVEYMKELGINIVIEDKRPEQPRLKFPLDTYIGSIDSRDGKGPEDWYGRDYQVALVEKLNNHVMGDVYFPRGILDAATNAGKNSITGLIVRNYERQYRTIFMVKSTDIYDQAVDFFSQVIGEPVGEVRAGHCKPKWFTVAMQQSLYRQAKKNINIRKWLHDMEVLFVDESDEAGADEYASTIKYINAGMRVFVSGTPLDGDRVGKMVCMGLSGKVLGIITNRFLVDNGYSQEPIINVYLNKALNRPSRNYPKEVEEAIWYSEPKLKHMKEIIGKHYGEPTLISFDEQKHGYYMLDKIQEMYPDLVVEIVHGDPKLISKNERKAIIQRFKQGLIDVLIASTVLKRGINIPSIRAFILADGGKSRRHIKQWIGRNTRHDKIHDEVYIYDWYDVGKWIAKHSRQRLRIYRDEGFANITFHYDNKKGVPILF